MRERQLKSVSRLVRIVNILIMTALLSFTLNAEEQTGSLTIRDSVDFYKNPVKELRGDLKSIIDNPDFANALIGVSVISLEKGEYFFKHNENKNFIPASTQKLLTTFSAISILGGDFKYSTKLFLDGELKDNGEFIGNLIIRGSGDPTLSKYYHKDPVKIMESWINKLDSMGIRSIQGNIIGDDRYFDNVFYGPGWAWDDMLYPFSSQVNSLSFNDNKIDVYIFQGDSVGETTNIEVYPPNSYIRIINNIKTGKPEALTNIIPVRETGTNLIELSGVISYDSTDKRNYEKIQITIDNPTLFFLNVFREVLESRQIRFRGALLDVDDLNTKVNYRNLRSFIEYESPELSEIIKIINRVSHNLGAEMLLKTVAKENTGIGSFETGTQVIEEFLSKNGVNTNNIVIVDGSGLSRMNLFTPNYLITILSSIYRSQYKNVMLNSLARPGKKGTLERRLTRSLATDKVFAKTGSMNNVSTICGYVVTRDGEDLAFAIMFQNFTVPSSLAKNLQDLILMRLTSFTRER